MAVLTAMLSLNASQQANAKAIFNEEDAASKPLLEQLRQASDALLSAQKAAAPDAEANAAITTAILAENEMLQPDQNLSAVAATSAIHPPPVWQPTSWEPK